MLAHWKPRYKQVTLSTRWEGGGKGLGGSSPISFLAQIYQVFKTRGNGLCTVCIANLRCRSKTTNFHIFLQISNSSHQRKKYDTNGQCQFFLFYLFFNGGFPQPRNLTILWIFDIWLLIIKDISKVWTDYCSSSPYNLWQRFDRAWCPLCWCTCHCHSRKGPLLSGKILQTKYS